MQTTERVDTKTHSTKSRVAVVVLWYNGRFQRIVSGRVDILLDAWPSRACRRRGEAISVVRPLPDVQDQRHRPGLDHRHHRRRQLLLPLVELVVSGHGRLVHVPPRLRLSHRWRSHHQQVLQVLPAGQLSAMFGPVRSRRDPVLVLVLLLLLRFAHRRRHARRVLLVAIVLGQVIELVHLKSFTDQW